MVKYILKRIGSSILTLFILVTIVFVLMQFIPGDPFNDPKVPEATQEAMRAYYGLDKPIIEQYFTYMKNLLQGDLGSSLWYTQRTVNEIIANAFPYSIDLGIRALLFAVTFGVLLGVVSALKQNTVWDTLSMGIAVVGISVPSFIVASLLQYVFAVKLKILPVALWENFSSTILPTVALGLGSVASIARMMRTSMLELANEEYIKTAKAKGLNETEITIRHKIRNSSIPLITLLGPMIAILFTGTFVIENIFAIPGLGQYYVTSIQTLDYSLIMGMTIVYAAFLVTMQLVVDIIYVLVDPRIRLYKK